MRDPDDAALTAAEQSLRVFLAQLAVELNVEIRARALARFDAVAFCPDLLTRIEESARGRSLRSRRMTSGAGHDAQMMARICPSAMIFVPSTDGISHNPHEYTAPEHLQAGANVLLDVVGSLAAVGHRSGGYGLRTAPVRHDR
jgi:N-carbamoyl-L-amino-acid hydrolase